MAAQQACPPQDALTRLARGEASRQEIDAFAAHLEQCDSCADRLDQLEAQAGILPLLKNPAGRALPVVDTGIEAAMQRLAQLADRSSGQHSTTVDEAGIDDVPLPARLGRYRIEDKIGSGGMGIVVRVHDEDFQRPLAMKVMKTKYRGRKDYEERFFREARLTGQLQHPGVPPVQDLGRLPDGRPYFIMKLIKGKSLAALLKERASGGRQPHETSPDQEANVPRSPDDLPRLLTIFEQICQTVGYAHSHGILHRDLKPLNVMVGAFGEVQVMDWGLAKVWSQKDDPSRERERPEEISTVFSPPNSVAPEATAAGSIMGTPAYMAPEQARGEVENLDPRADVFGLGAILCKILTGKPAFPGGSDSDQLGRARRGDLAEAGQRLDRCGADAQLVRLAKECLAPAREDRPRDAVVVAKAVAQYQEDLQQRLKQAEIQRAWVQARLVEEAKRRGLRVALVALSFGFVLAASLGGIWYVQDQADREINATKLKAEKDQEEIEKKAELERQEADKKTHREKLTEGVTAALAMEAQMRENLLGRLTNPKKAHSLFNDLDEEWKTILENRKSVLGQAEKLEASSQGLLPHDLVAKLRQQQKQWNEDNEDWKLAKELDDTRGEASLLGEGILDRTVAAKNYPKVFVRWGWEIETGAPAKVAAQIKASPIRYALVAALDHWADMTEDGKLRSRLLEIAKQADPDPWGDQFRDVAVWNDAGSLQELAKQIKLQDHSPRIVLALASRLFKADAETAISLLREAAILHPRDFWFHVEAASFAKNSVEMVGCYKAALAVRPNSVAANNNLGFTLAGQKDLRGAVAAFQRAVANNPRFAFVYYNLGIALFEQKDLPGAVAAYEKAIAKNDQYANAYYNLGIALKAQKDLPGAVAAYQKAIKSNDQYVEAYINLGIALAAQQDLPGAVAAYQKAIAINPNDADAYYGLGVALYDQKNWPGAVAACRKAIAINPRDALAYNTLGNALNAQKDLPGAVAALQKAIAINPQFAEAYSNLANVLKAQGDLPGAVAALQKAVAINPQNDIAYNNLAFALAAQKDLPGAMAALKKAIAINPQNAEAHYNLGAALTDQKDLPGAMAAFKKAITIKPQYVQPHLGLGWALREEGNFAEGAAAIEQALKLLPPEAALRPLAEKLMQECQHLISLEKKLPLVLKGEQPSSAGEQIELAAMCEKYKKQYHAAFQLYGSAFKAQPELAKDSEKGHRYNAACAAVLAAAGQGKDAGKLEEKDKAKLRRQALEWLQAELDALTKLLEANRDKAVQVEMKLKHWQTDADLAGVRDAKELANLPNAERQDWQQFWADVDALLKKGRAAVNSN